MPDPPRHSAPAEQSSAALLADLGVALIEEAGDVSQLLQRLADAAREVSRARYAAIGVLDGDGTGLEEFVTSGVDEEMRRRIGDPPRGKGLLGTIIQEKAAVRVESIADDPRSVGFPPGHPPMTNFLGLPIRLGSRIFGNIYVTDSDGAGGFTTSDERLLETLAAYAAIAIRGGELQEERQRWIESLEGICSISGAISSDLELSSLLPEATRRTRALLRCDTVGIGLISEGELRFPFAHGPNALRLEALGTSESQLDGVAAEVERALPKHHCLSEKLGAGGSAVGVLVVVSTGEFSVWQQSVVEVLGSHIAGAIANADQFAEERRRLSDEADRRAQEIEERLEREVQARALLAQEDERARVARELHDETGQLLTGVGLRLKALETRADPGMASEVADLRAHVRGAQDSMRQILRRLRPVDLERGLGGAIEDSAARAQLASDCEVTVEMAGLPPTPEEVDLVLYRVVQEALTNVVRHSEATHATVTLTALENHLRLTVEDDGVGFDPDAATERLGLRGISERVELIGGTLRVTSSPGAGTAITVDVEPTP